jgi:hypothetical protein
MGKGREGIFPFPPRKIAQDYVKRKLEIPDDRQRKGEREVGGSSSFRF